MAETIQVKVIESRQVADDIYAAGDVVEMLAERALRYPAYFRPLEPVKGAYPKSMTKGELIKFAGENDIDLSSAGNNHQRVNILEDWIRENEGE
jgi:hypothetical protein